jgi:lipopolysaccharide cholinephosphotransferase
MSKAHWLEQFHGCPFTVCVDLFPLDYVPRDENERAIQTEIFKLIGRIAQLAGNIENGDEFTEEEQIAGAKAEIIGGLDYLESNFNISIDRSLYDEERWFDLSSEMWKWANYIAMVYDEDEGDYLAEYVDYAEWENKKFLKEWFSETYGATFENFMLPIPKEYDKVLRTVYGNYEVYSIHTGRHEYPYYARQLRELKNCEDYRGTERKKSKYLLMTAWKCPKSGSSLLIKLTVPRKM